MLRPSSIYPLFETFVSSTRFLDSFRTFPSALNLVGPRPYSGILLGEAAMSSSSASARAANLSEQSNRLLEDQNDEHMRELHSKVSILKDLSIRINNEVIDSNRELDSMGMDFSNVGSMLSGTMKKLENMAKTEHGKHMLYLIGFSVLVFFVLWYLISWR